MKGSQKLQEGRSWVRLGGTQRPSVTARGQNSTVTSTHYVLFYICVLFENKKKKKKEEETELTIILSCSADPEPIIW